MKGPLVVTLLVETKWLLLWFPGTELFTFVVLYLSDGLEMADTKPLYGEILCIVTVDSCHGLQTLKFSVEVFF